MAERGILRYILGMHKDTSRLDQPPGTVRYARNTVSNQVDNSITNEQGTESIEQLPPNSIAIGSLPITDGSIIYFLKRDDRSEIGILEGGNYSALFNPALSTVNDTDLKFNVHNPIEAEFKFQANGDLMIYWVDDLNPPRALNVTRQKESAVNKLYGNHLSQSPDTKAIDELNLFPHAGPVPHVEFKEVVMGGGCKTGMYYLCLGYTDDDLVETDFVTIANPVPVVDDVENVNPIESYDGSPGNVITGKSLTWNVSNINTGKKFLTVAVIQRSEGLFVGVRTKNIEISNRDSFPVVFSGDSSYMSSSAEDLLIDNVRFTSAKTIVQLDNALYMGNMKNYIDIGYQKYANFITVRPRVKRFEHFDPFVVSKDNLEKKKVEVEVPIDNGYRYANNIFDYMGYMREEVYALYIAFIMKDGSMSYAYHIPGRPALENVPVGAINDRLGVTDPTINEDQRMWETTDPDWGLINVTTEELSYFFHWYDFSNTGIAEGRNMNFWKNLNEFYPDTEDFDVVDAEDPTGSIPLPSLRGENVRHHRFPSNDNPDYSSIYEANIEDVVVNPEKTAVVHWYWMGGVNTYDNTSNNPHVLIGQWAGENDFDGARTFQENEGCVDGMGGSGNNTNNHPEHSIDPNAGPPDGTFRHVTSCTPVHSTRITLSLIQEHFGCAITSYDQIKFEYDPHPPPIHGLPMYVGWDAPSAHHFNPQDWHCSRAFACHLDDVNGNSIEFTYASGDWEPSAENKPDWNWLKPRPGWVCWVECESALLGETTVDHSVRALGFNLDDLKVPRSIADKVQGFRIYRADREHHNRTVLGQAPLHGMAHVDEVDPSGCDGGGEHIGIEDYWLPAGQPVRTKFPFPAIVHGFHDFYLLNRRHELSPATHVKLQYSVGMLNFKGTVKYYKDAEENSLDPQGDTVYSCWKPQVRTSFHMGGDYHRFYGYDDAGNELNRRNFQLYDKAKAYIPGNSIYKGKDEGFERHIYNIGGETHIALKTERFIPYLPCDEQADWRKLRSDKSGSSFEGYTDSFEDKANGLMLHIANLKALKTDVYDPVDVQDLVWTGFEVTGEFFENYVVEEDGTPAVAQPQFHTAAIFGGDTYLARYGNRITHRAEWDKEDHGELTLARDYKSVIFSIVECTENINFRHIEDKEFPYFPGAPLSDVLEVKADNDLNDNSTGEEGGKLKYNEDYSSVNNVKFITPLPWQLKQSENFKVDIVRSNKASAISLVDNYRQFVTDQVKSLNNDRGDLWKIVAMNNILLFHMEDSIYMTKGKQRMKTSSGGEAFIGAGDILEQAPDELRQTDAGYMGTRSQFAGVVTPHGYFCIDNIKRNVFLIGQSVESLSSDKYGMSRWLKENLPYALEAYGFNGKIDDPIVGMGYVSVWDENYSRVIFTKRDLKPTQLFIDNFITEAGGHSITAGAIFIQDGVLMIGVSTHVEPVVTVVPLPLEEGEYLERDSWTISFAITPPQQSGRVGHWEGFHDYHPYHYTAFGVDVLSYADGSREIWSHTNFADMSRFYGNKYDFEVEMVHNDANGIDKLYSSFSILVDVLAYSPGEGKHTRQILNAGFTSFNVFTSDAASGPTPLEYLNNLRKMKSAWHIKGFRDMSAEQVDASPYYTQPGPNVVGGQNTGTVTNVSENMFNVSGMYETFNPAYIDPAKPWNTQGKFIDRFFAIRLTSDNADNNLINLYNTTTNLRKFHR